MPSDCIKVRNAAAGSDTGGDAGNSAEEVKVGFLKMALLVWLRSALLADLLSFMRRTDGPPPLKYRPGRLLEVIVT